MDDKSDFSRIFEMRDDPFQERKGQNNYCLNRNPSIARISESVLKVYYCPGTSTPNTYLINLEEFGIDLNDWFNVMISVSKNADNGAVEKLESYDFEIKLTWQNISFTVASISYEFQHAKITTNSDLYMYKKSNVQVRNFESTGMKFTADRHSFW